MKKFHFIGIIFIFVSLHSAAQNIIPIQHNGVKYEVLDMTSKGKVSWGGYEELSGKATGETDGSVNTKVIVAGVGNNTGFEGKPYAAKLCSEANAGGKNEWYLPAKKEADMIYLFKDKLNVEERGTIWTSTEASGTQAVTKYWYTGAHYNSQKVEEYHFVCLRKIE